MSKNLTRQLIEKLTADPKATIVLTEGHIRSLKRYANDGNNIMKVEDACDAHQLHISADQQAKGLAWLKAVIWTKTGKLSLSKQALVFKEHHREIITNLDHFELAGLTDCSTNYRPFHMPIYRAVAKDGKFFEYLYGSWQSGIGVEIWQGY